MHLLVLLAGLAFNFFNALLIGGWLGGYGRITTSQVQFFCGMVIWAAGFLGNLYHENILRNIRVNSVRMTEDVAIKGAEPKRKDISYVDGRVYIIPQGGLFEWVLYPHVSVPI